MTKTNTTLRGHCPCCGNLQAVPRGISKHGYTVEHGWFQGVCGGEGHRPIEEDRSVTDKIVIDINKQCAELDQLAADLAAGRVTPKGKDKTRYNAATQKRESFFVAWEFLTAWEQSDLARNEAYKAQYRAKTGRDFAAYLTSIADQFHGKALIEEAKKEAAPRIARGEKKLFDGRLVLTADYVQGARVYYNGGRGWIGTQKWRSLPNAA
jgi:hypothetical protein